MKRVLSLIAGIFLFYSCDLTVKQDITSQYLIDGIANGNLDVYLQDTQVFRYKGKPGTVTIPIGTQDLSKYESCFILHVATGTTQATIVSSAIIKIDGQEVLNTSDFSKNGGQFNLEVCDLIPTSVISVEVRGEPGSYIDIWIEGKLSNRGTFTDIRDGHVYKWTKIGNQTWMAENLAYLPDNVYPPSDYSFTDNRYYVYEYYGTNANEAKLSDNYKKWGVLYNAPAALQENFANNSNPSAIQGVCPDGWHLPSYEEWIQLGQFITQDLGTNTYSWAENETSGFWTGIGSHLRSKSDWLVWSEFDEYGFSTLGVDTYGFTASPAGRMHWVTDQNPPTGFDLEFMMAFYWSSTSTDWEGDKYFHSWALPFNSLLQLYKTQYSANGFSIRCMKDNN
jgi:uncharacterized protein (TIGR02145 family)